MRRKTFDALVSVAGLVLAVVLLVAGGLLVWGHSFVDNQVHNQLAAQKIVFPAANSPEIKALPASDATAMKQYAGQLMTNGAQAETWADHFIAVHLVKIGGGQTYSQLSGKAIAQPTNVALANQVNLVFRGTTLRGLLLNAYAFWKMGQIALWAAIVSFIGAGLLLIFSAIGFWHTTRTSPESEVLYKLAATEKVTTA
ncbi:MAG: hypothetical protein ACLPN6_21550 [Streptosporangiaceae bacterium]|jgi:hypothetical protein|nr:hypothetical protein [Actinomycetota bacterium]